MARKQLTVAKLIEYLGRFPGEAPAWVEGCDCAGEAIGVVMDEDGLVMVVRNGGVDRWDEGDGDVRARYANQRCTKAELSSVKVLGKDD